MIALGETSNKKGKKQKTKEENNRQKRKQACRARHRLLSIYKDTRSLKERLCLVLASLSSSNIIEGWPWIANKQCGSWYLPLPPDDGLMSSISPQCYFKSTDGHVGTYNVSLKRLNLTLVKVLHQHGGAFLVDSSVRKVLPDSFSRTIPIWACVLNRVVQKYRQDLHVEASPDWDMNLYTPASIVSPEEHSVISNLIDSRVELLYESKAIVDPRALVNLMEKPIRSFWISNNRIHRDTLSCSDKNNSILQAHKFLAILCFNPSFYSEDGKNHIRYIGAGNNPSANDKFRSFYYMPGAADDHETWSRGLTPKLFWSHREQLLDSLLSEDAVDALIDSLIKEKKSQELVINDDHQFTATMNLNQIGMTNIWVGSRRAGRPPECWDSFDAILNVTENEYPDIHEFDTTVIQKFYLQLAVSEGKRDKTELERWMPVGLVFLLQHLQQGRRVLVHCAQGKDRSVAMVLALVALFCPMVYPLKLRSDFDNFDVKELIKMSGNNQSDYKDDKRHLRSGLSNYLVDILLNENGRDLFLQWVHQQLDQSVGQPFANKDSLRIALHLIKQDREVADPTRKTMQKLSRFFMSSPLYRN
jgi:tRNA A64-2'-O-ribosylphosphate transferase